MLVYLLSTIAIAGLAAVFAVPFITHAQEQRRMRHEANRRRLLSRAQLTVRDDRQRLNDPRASSGLLKSVVDAAIELTALLLFRKR